ncbi:MAG: P-loop NTPase fold protein [Anaerolineales bacterium]
MDREIIEQAITIKFANYKDSTTEAREYLEKIIALPFDLPPLSGKQMQNLVEGSKANLPEAEECMRVFALGQEPNPRKVKRTINVFLLLWTLANRRRELAGEIQPVRLAKLVVIQHSYRDLYRLLNANPKYLGELEIYYRKSEIESF